MSATKDPKERTLRNSARLTTALIVFTTFGSLAAEAAGHARPGKLCEGKSLLQEFAAADPLVYSRILRDAETIENGRAVLWKLERPGFQTSYLFGTVHLTDDRVTRLTDATRTALSEAKTLLIENASQQQEATSGVYSAATKQAVFSDGRSLDKLLTKDEFAKVRRSIEGVGVPAAAAHIYKPWMITMLLAASECERRRVQKGYLVLDMVVAEQARSLGMPVEGMETTEEQLLALASVPEDEQLGMLRANLALVDKTDDLLETMVQLYLERRISALWDLQIALARRAGVAPDAFASFERTLVVERNRKMRDVAISHMEKGPIFIATGALHLPGKTGLVALMREAGFTVTAIE